MNPRIFAHATWNGTLFDMPGSAMFTDAEIASRRDQAEREAGFIDTVNALGGMPRTVIVNGVAKVMGGPG